MTIRLNDIRLYAYHGVLEEERTVGAWFRVQLTTRGDFVRAMEEDMLEATVNYAEMASIVKREMAIPSRLLEHVAWRIGTSILQEMNNVEEIEVTVHKEHPPVCVECASASVTVRLDRK